MFSWRFQVSALLCASIGFVACDDKVPEPTSVERRTLNSATGPAKDVTGGITELKIEDEAVGTGAEVKSGDKVRVHYTGTLVDGTQFDSSREREPFSFAVGARQVIVGWDEGVVGMKVGGKRKLSIPGDKAYGASGRPPTIPGNATLLFDIELIGID